MTIKYLEGSYTLIRQPLPWQERGLSQTASGYGSKLTSSQMVLLPDGRKRRVYITCWSNTGSAWINLDGQKQYLEGSC